MYSYSFGFFPEIFALKSINLFQKDNIGYVNSGMRSNLLD